MVRGPLRIYADTSVFGGAFDEEFKKPSREFFSQVRDGQFRLVVSALVEAELEPAPEDVRRLYQEMFPICESVDVTDASVFLRNEYLARRIVSPQYARDAMHVALATAADCSVIVSWNFRHIVHWKKVPLYNAVNEINGYRPIAIHSPAEVIRYEDQEI